MTFIHSFAKRAVAERTSRSEKGKLISEEEAQVVIFSNLITLAHFLPKLAGLPERFNHVCYHIMSNLLGGGSSKRLCDRFHPQALTWIAQYLRRTNTGRSVFSLRNCHSKPATPHEPMSFLLSKPARFHHPQHLRFGPTFQSISIYISNLNEIHICSLNNLNISDPRRRPNFRNVLNEQRFEKAF